MALIPTGRLTVMVTGAGGPAGMAVVKALRHGGHRVVAADADPLAVGLRLADVPAVIPACHDRQRSFVAELAALALTTAADVLISTVAEELSSLAGLHIPGLRTWLPSPAAVERCVDKWAFAKVMEDAGLPVPATALASAVGVPGPWVVKPRYGRGSRDVMLVDLGDELMCAIRRVEDPLVQSRLSGREFTVDALVDRDGSLAGAVPRWRLETRGGISTKGETFVDDELIDLVGRVLRAVGLTGPANVQGFVGERGISITEVNPRFSGGLPLSLAAGADLVGEYVRGILGFDLRRERLTFRPGVRMLRHFEEVFEG